jgi:NAD(P)-dependent dehydrogenase (short-subunit alcohol dehydrogenase family)
MEITVNSALKNKRVIILGGSSGIGLATAQIVAQVGAEVVIVSSNAERIKDALETLPDGCRGETVDLNNENAINQFFNQIDFLDHLVYTAGENLELNHLSQTNLIEARNFFNIRFWGALASVKYASPKLRAGGSISLISGTASSRPGAGWALASSICGAIEGLVKALAVELAPLRVNCVVPGVIKTNLWDSMPEDDRQAMYMYCSNQLLLKRVGEAQDVARGFLYLMEQNFGTGQSLLIDGGTVLV